MEFSEKLQKYRKEKKLTQTELAEKAKLSRRSISSYENGTSYPKSKLTFTLIAEALGVDVNVLKNEHDDFILDASSKYGYRGRKQAEHLVNEMGALFAGGGLNDEDLDGVMKAMQDHYWRAKEINKKKYTPTKYKTNI